MTNLHTLFTTRAALAFTLGQAARDGQPVPSGVLRRYRIAQRKLKKARQGQSNIYAKVPSPVKRVPPEWCRHMTEDMQAVYAILQALSECPTLSKDDEELIQGLLYLRSGSLGSIGRQRILRMEEQYLRGTKTTPPAPLVPDWCTLCGSATNCKRAGQLLCVVCEDETTPPQRNGFAVAVDYTTPETER